MKSDDVNKSIQDMTTNKMRERTKALAEQAGFVVWDGAVDWSCNYDDELERFAEVVRADEREACAKVCEENSLMFGDSALIGVCRTNASRIRSRGEE